MDVHDLLEHSHRRSLARRVALIVGHTGIAEHTGETPPALEHALDAPPCRSNLIVTCHIEHDRPKSVRFGRFGSKLVSVRSPTHPGSHQVPELIEEQSGVLADAARRTRDHHDRRAVHRLGPDPRRRLHHP
jgi:hypothetical protein